MTRKEFIKICGLFGIELPLPQVLLSCKKEDSPLSTPFQGKVLVIGAGAGGLAAAYFLKQQGTEFEVLEASAEYGGRMKINTDFADFPIPLGAEWLETNPNIFSQIVNNPSVSVDIETVPDLPDRKFVNYSWFNFFQDYIHPSVRDQISYNTQVEAINYSGSSVEVSTNNGTFTADKLIIAIPLKILRDGNISFSPALPSWKQAAMENTQIWDGFKAFFEFSTNFYGDEEYVFPINPETDGEKIYYNAALGQNTQQNILGLFAVGKPATELSNIPENQLKEHVLNELDGIYNNQATASYIKHLSQDWNKEPFIQSGYLSDHADWKTVRELGKPISNKIYFAGGAYTDGEDWVSVHAAALSGKESVRLVNG